MERLNDMPGSTRNALRRKMQQIEHNTNRGAYNAVLDQMAEGRVSENSLVTEGYLRLEKDLSQHSTIRFPVLTNDGEKHSTERRLNISDMFLVTHMGFMTYEASALTPVERAQARFSTNEFSGGTVQNSFRALYAGSFSIRVDQTVFFDKYDALRFYRAGTAQVQTPASGPAYQVATYDSVNYPFSPIVPFITLGGRDNNKIELDLGANINFATESTATAVVMFRGLLIQNAYAAR